MKIWDYLNAINHTKEPLMDSCSDDDEKAYVPFLINRSLSYFEDTILYANDMNMAVGHLPKKMQFDYLRLSCRKRKRFSKWDKKTSSEDISLIKEYYECNTQKAMEIAEILNDTQKDAIKNILSGKYK